MTLPYESATSGERALGDIQKLLRDLRERAGLTQAQAGALVRVSEIAWRSWENGARRMPAPAMELLCIVLAVGTVERGPYIAPGDWMLPWVRNELALWFRRPAPLAPPMCRR